MRKIAKNVRKNEKKGQKMLKISDDFLPICAFDRAEHRRPGYVEELRRGRQNSEDRRQNNLKVKTENLKPKLKLKG